MTMMMMMSRVQTMRQHKFKLEVSNLSDSIFIKSKQKDKQIVFEAIAHQSRQVAFELVKIDIMLACT